MTGTDYAKLWTDILLDGPIAALEDRSWRRWIEFIVLAHMEGDGTGVLPDDRTVWRVLYTTSEELEQDIQPLVDLGKVKRKGERWFVVNFAKRQSREYATRQRKARYRARQKDASGDGVGDDPGYGGGDATGDDPGYEGVTPKGPVEKSRVEDSREEKSKVEKKGASPFSEFDSTAPEPITSRHPVISTWRDVVERFPPSEWYDQIVRDSNNDRTAVRRVMQLWKQRGWNITDYDAICERLRYVKADDLEALAEQEKKLNESTALADLI